MYVGNAMLLILNLPLVGIFIRILNVKKWFLMPAVIALSFVAVYAVSNSPFDILLMAGFGVVGYLLKKCNFPLASVILGLILGPLVEKNLRRAMSISDGDWTYLFHSSPICIGFYIAAIASLFLPILLKRIARNPTDRNEAEKSA
jgi:putative tricarboxylic transport membrane protein